MTEKFRIVTITNNKLLSVKHQIQRNFLFWWITIEKKECCETKPLNFDTFEDAETYLMQNYFCDGGDVFKPAPNVYHYTKWEDFDYYDGMCL